MDDAAPNDSAINWKRSAEGKFLWISVPTVNGFEAVHIGGKGQILFRATESITDYETQPVGKVWDPSKKSNERFTDIFFKPQPFKLRMLNMHDSMISLQDVPAPPISDAINNHWRGVRVHSIASDGSVLANVSYEYNEDEGEHPESPEVRASPPLGQYVFFWGGGGYDSCKIVGEDRGYREYETDPISWASWTTNSAIGFKEVNSGGNTKIYALVSDQDRNESDDFTDLTIKAYPVQDGVLGSPVPAGGLANRYYKPEIYSFDHHFLTPSGRIAVPFKESPDSLVTQLRLGNETLPSDTYVDSITDLPSGASGTWALGCYDGPLRIASGASFPPAQSAAGALRFDLQGIGIGNGYEGCDIWYNDKWYTLEDATGDGNFPEGLSPKEITPDGLIWASDDSRIKNAILLPVALAADANADDRITFDDRDGTKPERPFRFWINNDQDNVEEDEPIFVQYADHMNSVITTNRDLEDFCRLKLHVNLSNRILRRGNFRIGIKFRKINWGEPSIRIWENQDATGGKNYLTEENAAALQREVAAFPSSSNSLTIIPKSFWEKRSNSIAHLVFEGVSKGEGELCVVLVNDAGEELGYGGTVWIKLLDVREMYRRARIVNDAEDIPNPRVNPNLVVNSPQQAWVWDPWDWPYSKDPGAKSTTVIAIHGWRLKYMDFMNWSDTGFKRLWHQGFRGEFFSFRWATFSADNNGLPYGLDEKLEELSNDEKAIPPGGLTYNSSEYRAWICAPQLADFVNSLPNPGRRSLYAHSMGNVITGAALRKGMSIQNYAMCNAAMSAMAYDSDLALRNNSRTGQEFEDIFLPGEFHITPDTNSSMTIRNQFGLTNQFNFSSMPNTFNFGLPNDRALANWSSNNRFFKPDNGYEYTQDIDADFPLYYNTTGHTKSPVTDVPEAMGFVTKSLTRAVGAELRTRGCISSNNVVGMDQWFGGTHSAQWRWNNQSTHQFWKQIFDKLQLGN